MSAAVHTAGALQRAPATQAAAEFDSDAAPFSIDTVTIGAQRLRIGRQAGMGDRVPLLLFNGIGANIELLAPLARALPDREIVTFDVPGVGRSPLPPWPYRFRHLARLACGVLDHYEYRCVDVLGISWGGALAQQFARSAGERCRRLILCATAPGVLMVPGRPGALLRMATPLRYLSPEHARRWSGHIYGGDFRADPDLATRHLKHVRWHSRLGYYLQIGAGIGWTSVPWLPQLGQRTLIMAGKDDPLVPPLNARLMNALIRRSELRLFDCGHLFLLTRLDESAAAIREFLDRT